MAKNQPPTDHKVKIRTVRQRRHRMFKIAMILFFISVLGAVEGYYA